MKHLINITKADTTKIILYEKLGQLYRDEKRMDSAVWSYKQALTINKKNNYSNQKKCDEAGTIAYILFEMGNYLESLNYTEELLQLSKQLNKTDGLGGAYLLYGHDFREMGHYRNAISNYFKAYHFWEIFHNVRHEAPDNTYTLLCIALTYLKMGKPDSALYYTNQRFRFVSSVSDGGYILLAERVLGDIYLAKGDEQTALKYYRQYIPDYIKYKERNRDLGFVLNSIASIFKKRNQNDSAKYYAKKALENAQKFHDQQNIYTASAILYNCYKNKADDIILPDTSNDLTDDKKWMPGGVVNRGDIIKNIDSLIKILNTVKEDTIKYKILRQMGDQYVQINDYDSGIKCGQQALELLRRNKHAIPEEISTLGFLGYFTYITGDFLMCIKYDEQSLKLSEKIDDAGGLAFALAFMGVSYEGLGDYRKAVDYLLRGKKQMERYESGHWAIQNLAEVYLKMRKLDSALYYNQKAYYIADTGHNQQYMKDFAIRVYAFIYAEKGDDPLALKYFRQFVSDFFNYNLNNREIGHAYMGMAKLFQKNNQIDSSVFYAQKALKSAAHYKDPEYIYNASHFLYSVHDTLHNESEAFKYFKIAQAAKDSMASIEKIRQIQLLAYEEQVREKELAEAETKEAVKRKQIIAVTSVLVLLSAFLVWYRIRQLRLKYKAVLEQKELEKLKEKYHRDLLELEAKALRSQMNPHFIYNCMNSIKSLIQLKDETRAVNYLTTFSKLIRTLFQNADKRQISLYDEIETCKHYIQLEAMRLNNKLQYNVDIDPNLDLKSIQVPALIIQPFIENAIWHGIVPRGEGSIIIRVYKEGDTVKCEVDDDGIGRELSKLNKPVTPVLHESKGVHLSQERLNLQKLLNETNASIDTIDKIEYGKATGTKVILTFNLN